MVQSNPTVRQWMQDQNMSSYAALEASFMKRVLGLTAAAGRFPIVWQVLGRLEMAFIVKTAVSYVSRRDRRVAR